MSPTDVETVYEALARQLDAVPVARRELFLAKLALLLAHDLDAPDRFVTLVQQAAAHLET